MATKINIQDKSIVVYTQKSHARKKNQPVTAKSNSQDSDYYVGGLNALNDIEKMVNGSNVLNKVYMFTINIDPTIVYSKKIKELNDFQVDIYKKFKGQVKLSSYILKKELYIPIRFINKNKKGGYKIHIVFDNEDVSWKESNAYVYDNIYGSLTKITFDFNSKQIFLGINEDSQLLGEVKEKVYNKEDNYNDNFFQIMIKNIEFNETVSLERLLGYMYSKQKDQIIKNKISGEEDFYRSIKKSLDKYNLIVFKRNNKKFIKLK